MIKKSIPKRPSRILLYGVPSVGKTTLAANAPAPVFICVEDGARELGVDAWVFDDKTNRVQPKTLEEFRAAIRSITADHTGYKSLVIDGLGEVDKLVQQYLCAQNPKWKGNIQHEGFGKPESMILQQWREIVAELEEANTSGLAVFLLGHSRVDKFTPPDGPIMDRYQLAVTSHKLGDVAGFLFGWADVVGFSRFEPMVREEGKRTIGIGMQGARVMHLARMDAFDAKCRYRNAPPQIPMSWADLSRVMTASELSAVSLKQEIETLIPSLPEDKQAAVKSWLGGNPTVDELVLGLDRAKASIIIKAA